MMSFFPVDSPPLELVNLIALIVAGVVVLVALLLIIRVWYYYKKRASKQVKRYLWPLILTSIKINFIPTSLILLSFLPPISLFLHQGV